MLPSKNFVTPAKPALAGNRGPVPIAEMDPEALIQSVLAPGAQVHLLFGANGDGAPAVIPWAFSPRTCSVGQAGIHGAASL
jgi:hypothetical protein